MTNLTQAAAQKCADLANAVDDAEVFVAADFINDVGGYAAFRRYVETIDARDREVLALLETFHLSTAKVAAAAAKLRADLLPDPAPTLLREFLTHIKDPHPAPSPYLNGVQDALDWIAKREGKEA